MHPFVKKFPLKYAVILTTIMILIHSSFCSLHHLSLCATSTSLLRSQLLNPSSSCHMTTLTTIHHNPIIASMALNARTYCMLYVLALSIVQRLTLAVSVVYGQWVNLVMVSAWHLVLCTSLLYPQRDVVVSPLMDLL